MSDDYLWDRSGFPERDERELEDLLAPFKYATSVTVARRAPRSRRRKALIAAGFGMAAAACVAAGWFAGSSSNETSIAREELARAPVAAAAPRAIGASDDAGSVQPIPPSVTPQLAAPPPVQTADPVPPAPGVDLLFPDDEPEPDTGVIDPWSKKTPAPTAAPQPLKFRRGPNGLLNPYRDDDDLPEKLSASQIQSVIRAKTAAVRNSCLELAGAGTSRVQLTLELGASGRVASARTSPSSSLGSCVARGARAWTFPRARRSTTVNIPFVFTQDPSRTRKFDPGF